MATKLTFRWSFLLMTLISVGLLLAITFDLSEWLRGGYGWRWGYISTPYPRMIVLGLVIVGYLIVIGQLQKRRLWMLFLGVMLGATAIAWGVAYLRDGDALYTMLVRTLSSGATAPHPVGVKLDSIGTQWQDWSALMPTLPRHVALSPPGAPFWYALLESVFNAFPSSVTQALRAPLFPYQCHVFSFTQYSPTEWAIAWFGITMPFWASLIVIPLFATAKQFFSDEASRRIIIAWALVPSIALWAGSWNSLYPVFAITSFLYLHLGITNSTQNGLKRARSLRYLLISGFVAGIASFINFAFMPMFLLFGLYTLISAFLGQKPIHTSRLFHAVMVGIIFGVGMITVWGIYWLFTKETPLEILNVALNDHLELDRNYWFWVVMHVWDWVLFAGIMWALLSLYGLFWGFRRHEKGTIQPILLLSLSLWLTVLITTLSNTARSETGRVWSWMIPFLLLSAYDGIIRLINQSPEKKPQFSTSWWVVNILQASAVLVLGSYLSVFDTELTQISRPTPIENTIPVQATFTRVGDNATFHLVGWRGEYDPDQNALIVSLNWTSDQQNYDVLWFGATPVSPDGTAGNMVIWQPGDYIEPHNQFLTTCWQPDENPIGDIVVIPLPENPMSGEWWVSIAIFGDKDQPEGRLLVNGSELQMGIGGIAVGSQ